MTLEEMELIESEIRDWASLDLNYSNADVIDVPGERLQRWPFCPDNKNYDQTLRIHSAWRSLRHLIHDLKELQPFQTYAQCAIRLKSSLLLDSNQGDNK